MLPPLSLLVVCACYVALSLAIGPTTFTARRNLLSSGTVISNSTLYNVISYGAVGNGITDDTAAVQAALSACAQSELGGTVVFPSGQFLITKPLLIVVGAVRFQIAGEGWSSIVLWHSDADVFVWSGAVATEITIQDLKIASVGSKKSASSTAINFTSGVVRSLIYHVMIGGEDGSPPDTPMGSGINFGPLTDSVSVLECQMWLVTGTGVTIGKGSEVRIEGGRIIGTAARNDGSIGVHVTGNNGGVHIVATDVIGLQEGVRLEDSSGAGSNREIFISQATMDSNWRGLSVLDNSYVDITGCWAASSVQDNIWVAPGLAGPLLVMTGGTIFNAGAYGGDPNTQNNGIVVNSGSFQISGVAIRNNLGKGIWVASDTVKQFSVTGCRIVDNGIGALVDGAEFVVTGNVFGGNTQPNSWGQQQQTAVIANNLGA